MTKNWKESIFIEQLLCPNMAKLGHVQHQQHKCTRGMKKMPGHKEEKLWLEATTNIIIAYFTFLALTNHHSSQFKPTLYQCSRPGLQAPLLYRKQERRKFTYMLGFISVYYLISCFFISI